MAQGTQKKEEKWVIIAKKADFNGIGKEFSIDPLIARLIHNRGIEGKEEIRRYLYGTRKDLHDPHLLKGTDAAAQIIRQKIAGGKKIRVIGDYDIDGIMSSYMLTKGFRLLGGDVDTVIPHRIEDGYGLNDRLIREAYEAGIDTIVTCDNGIAASMQIKLAKELGMTVIVTDHHEVPYEEADDGNRTFLLPPADVVIDPKQEGDTYPFSGICGAVVALKLIQVIFAERKIPEDFWEMAAFATIGDVMELVDENRILVKEGLSLMQDSANIGLRCLITACGLNDKKVTAYHVGFVLGPCMNATGRLDTALRAFSLLSCEDKAEAALIAAELKELNESRKSMTQKGVEEAIAQVESQNLEKDDVLIVYLPDCHESLAGIIAGKVREHYGKPSFVLTKAKEGIKGSGRSIPAYSMYEELSKCKQYFTKYGGHKMAAGISLMPEKLEPLRRDLNALSRLTKEDFIEKVRIDAAMPFGYVTNELVEELSLLEPFGNGNSKPLFAQKNLRLLEQSVFGKNKNVGRYRVEDESGHRYELTYFGDQEALKEYWEQKESIHVTYYPKFNVFRGTTKIQFILQNYL